MVFQGRYFSKSPLLSRRCFQDVGVVGLLALVVPHELLVCSFIGVILIARPQFLFGDPEGDPSEVVIPGERMQSVM